MKRTNRLLVVHEDWQTHGFGAEIAARAADELFAWLDAPVRRVAAKDAFCGYAPQLEDATLPQSDDILAALRDLLAYLRKRREDFLEGRGCAPRSKAPRRHPAILDSPSKKIATVRLR